MDHGKNEGARYRWSQIGLHWLVVAGLIVQYATSGAIGRTHHVPEPDPWDLFLHSVHNRLGLAIFVIVMLRLALRLRYGRPAWSTAMPRWKDRLATGVHAAFYVILAAQALTGAIASYRWWPMSAVHRWLFLALLITVALHLAGVGASLLLSWRETVWRITGLAFPKRPQSGEVRQSLDA
jgi:cytochrome b561